MQSKCPVGIDICSVYLPILFRGSSSREIAPLGYEKKKKKSHACAGAGRVQMGKPSTTERTLHLRPEELL